MRANPIQTSFNAGETSPELDGRVDLEKYNNSCSRMENFYPLVQGPAKRRPGTKFINSAKTRHADGKVWLRRFIFNRENAYMLEMGFGSDVGSYTRFHTSDGTVVESTKAITGITQANPANVTAVGHGYSTGNWVFIDGVVGMTQVNGKFFEIVVTGVDNFTLKDSLTGAAINSTGYTAYSAAGTSQRVHEISLGVDDFTDGSVNRDFAQSGDVLYTTGKTGSGFPKKITRTGASTFVLSEVDPDTGPFNDVDPDNTVTVYASARTGSVTLTASSATFGLSDVDKIFYLEQKSIDDILMWEPAKAVLANDIRRSDGKNYRAIANGTTGAVRPIHTEGSKYDGNAGVQWEFRDPGYCVLRITAVATSTSATATAITPVPDGAVGAPQASTRWAKSDWATNGYPTHVTFFRERLVFARASDQKMWFSVAGDYENFSDRDDGGVITADMSATIQISSEQANEIKWLAPGDSLIVGTASNEFIVSEITTQDVFGPGNIKAVPSTHYGSVTVSPARIGNTTFFVQSSGRKVRELAYSIENDGLASVDVTRLSPRIIPRAARVTQLAYQQEPNSIVWATRSDGVPVGFTYSREEDVFGWHRHTIGGTNSFVKSMDCIPAADGGRDELWLSVRRTIDGTTRHYIEVMQDDWDSSLELEDAFYSDSGLVYSGAANDVISGLDHLEGETVSILADGAVHPTRVVTDGAITLQEEVEKAVIGLAAPCKLATKRIEAGAQIGTAQGRLKRIAKLWVRFLDTLGGKFSPKEDGPYEPVIFRTAANPLDSAPPPFTGDKEVSWRGGYERDGIMWYTNDQPLPVTIVALMPEMETNE